jgi:catechol 2,3-dioxygenase-like lactoylglutathione lyase family enzyme
MQGPLSRQTWITGLDHVQIAIPRGEEARARAFYETVLGLSEVAKPTGLRARGGLWFAGPGLHLHLGVEDVFAPSRKAHVALLVRDLAEARAALQAARADVTDDDAAIGVDRFYASDPFGNRLEFIAERDRGFTTRTAR